MYTIDPNDPGYRAAMDRNVAFAIDALTRQARQLDHLDPAVATHHLAHALAAGRCDRQQLAALLAALAVHTVRADQHAIPVRAHGLRPGCAHHLHTEMSNSSGKRDDES